MLSQATQLGSHLNLFFFFFQLLNFSGNFILSARLLIARQGINLHWISGAHGAKILRGLLATRELHTLVYRRGVTFGRLLWSLRDRSAGAAFSSPIVTSEAWPKAWSSTRPLFDLVCTINSRTISKKKTN